MFLLKTSFSSEMTAATFVSQLSLDDYHKAEETFTNELTKYTKKQFFEVQYTKNINKIAIYRSSE